MKEDLLGNRMKSYENVYRQYLTKNNYFILRIDGKAFHSYTRLLDKPFDKYFNEAMDHTAITLCKQIQGVVLSYVQSDEITIVFTDIQSEETQIWFGGNIQKIVSVGASMATAIFNEYRVNQAYNHNITILEYAHFDARVFSIPDWIEVYNNVVWRNRDCMRNAVQMVARSLYSHKELMDKSCEEIIPMIEAKIIDWENYDPKCKFGRIISKKDREIETINHKNEIVKVNRPTFQLEPAWVFTKDPTRLQNLIPKR